MGCFLAYLAGWTATPQMMQALTRASHECCAKMDKKAGHECPKEGQRDKGGADCCMSCPMCYTMILPVASHEGPLESVVTQSYPDLQSVYLYSYHADAWKPPIKA